MADKLIPLGTSSAIPTKTRFHSSHYLEFEGFKFLLDAGENVQKRLLVNNISISKIDFILLTHWHGDHAFGLVPLLQSMAFSQRRRKLVIIGPRGTKSNLKKLFSVFGWNDAFELIIIEKKSKNPVTVFSNDRITINCVSGNHEVEQLSFCISKTVKNRIRKDYLKKMGVTNHPLLKKLQLGKNVRINGELFDAKKALIKSVSKKFCYVTDTLINDGVIRLCLGADVLLIECTYKKDMQKRAGGVMHLTTRDVNNFLKASGVKKLFLTHFSSRYSDLSDLFDEIKFNDKHLAKEDLVFTF